MIYAQSFWPLIHNGVILYLFNSKLLYSSSRILSYSMLTLRCCLVILSKAHATILKMGGGHIREAARFTITLGANKISNF